MEYEHYNLDIAIQDPDSIVILKFEKYYIKQYNILIKIMTDDYNCYIIKVGLNTFNKTGDFVALENKIKTTCENLRHRDTFPVFGKSENGYWSNGPIKKNNKLEMELQILSKEIPEISFNVYYQYCELHKLNVYLCDKGVITLIEEINLAEIMPEPICVIPVVITFGYNLKALLIDKDITTLFSGRNYMFIGGGTLLERFN